MGGMPAAGACRHKTNTGLFPRRRCQGAGADTGADAAGTKVALFPPPGELRNMEYGKMPEPVISRKLVTLHGGR